MFSSEARAKPEFSSALECLVTLKRTGRPGGKSVVREFLSAQAAPEACPLYASSVEVKKEEENEYVPQKL